jgi:lathosterol oxidase
MYHDDHHLHFHVNFGQHLSFWDRFHNTHRRVGRRYGVDVFGGKGEPDGSDDKGELVRY